MDELADLHREYRDSRSERIASELVARYESMTMALTSRFSYRPDAEDIRQVALTALVSALNNFDPDRGVAFPTYAIPTIAGAVKRYFRDQGWQVKPPRRLQETFLEVRQARSEMTLELGRTPTVLDVARRLNMPVGMVRESLKAAGALDHVSLDAPVRGGDTNLVDTVAGEDHGGTETSDTRLLVADLLRSLKEDERSVLVLTYFEDVPQREIAVRLGTNQVGVSRAKRRALKRLRAIHDASLARSA